MVYRFIQFSRWIFAMFLKSLTFSVANTQLWNMAVHRNGSF